MQKEPITIAGAARRLGKPERTVRTWASRYSGRRLLKPGAAGTTAWYDWHDLKTIARQLHLGEKVPATPEERDHIRALVAA
ncbi:hypothetical protein ACFXJ8_26085 [Nonomuraea sp. NPDC059194]|uniref:hypothetical protein n=1 Tax=Nonomuraea sp. NPDC059194 TaxID=3346764 RepID=UPI0036B57C51